MTEFGMGDIKRQSFNELVECLGRDMSLLKTKMNELNRGMATLNQNQQQLGEAIEEIKKMGEKK